MMLVHLIEYHINLAWSGAYLIPSQSSVSSAVPLSDVPTATIVNYSISGSVWLSNTSIQIGVVSSVSFGTSLAFGADRLHRT